MLASPSSGSASPPSRQPIAECPCPAGGLVDDEFRDAALQALDRLVVKAPGQPAHGAIQSHHAAGHLDPQGRAWHQVTAYAANLAVLGALRLSPSVLPLAEDWLRWQARHIEAQGPQRGVVLDHWVRDGGQEESICPEGIAQRLCGHVDAYDSTAATTLLVAEAYVRHGGDANLLREPPVRLALEAAAMALAQLTTADGLTLAKPDYPIVYTMDAAEVIASWRAWARLQRTVYSQPASAQISLALADRAQKAMHAKLWDPKSQAWKVSLDAGAPEFKRWYPDTMAQAWPMLWGVVPAAKRSNVDLWRRSMAAWQRRDATGTSRWTQGRADQDGFWWPAVAVAAHCVGQTNSSKAWVARARESWLTPESPFAWPFQVSDLMWLLWMADPVVPPDIHPSDLDGRSSTPNLLP